MDFKSKMALVGILLMVGCPHKFAFSAASVDDFRSPSPESSHHIKSDKRLRDPEILYEEGRRIGRTTRNYKEAFKLIEKAAKSGYPPAQYELGLMFEIGRGCKKDIEEAAKWYKEAAENDYPEAQNVLGSMHQLGTSPIEKDAEKAKVYYKKAALNGYSLAQENLERLQEEERTGYFTLREKD